MVARKPLTGTVASNVLEYGTGAINIDASRIGYQSENDKTKALAGDAFKRKDISDKGWSRPWMEDQERINQINREAKERAQAGRWPANVILDDAIVNSHDDWPRYFYCAKPSRKERNAGLNQPSTHPTVKPLALMRYLVRLVTPPGGTVLEPFAGSGTTLMACVLEGFNAIGIEMTDEYLPIIEGRIAWAQEQVNQQPESDQQELPL